MARILIVDDNLLVRTLLREILTTGGHDVVGEAKDGIIAADLFHELAPDLVLLDLVMPRRDGLATLEQLRVIDPAALVIICSAWLTKRRVIAALGLGARGFIAKPFDRPAVLATVERVLAEAGRPGARPVTPVTSDEERDDRREFDRRTAELPVVLTAPGAEPIRTSTIDVSGGGMQVAEATLDTGTTLTFRLELPEGRPPVEGRAHVVRRTDRGPCALAFDQIAIADHERLISFIRGA